MTAGKATGTHSPAKCVEQRESELPSGNGCRWKKSSTSPSDQADFQKSEVSKLAEASVQGQLRRRRAACLWLNRFSEATLLSCARQAGMLAQRGRGRAKQDNMAGDRPANMGPLCLPCCVPSGSPQWATVSPTPEALETCLAVTAWWGQAATGISEVRASDAAH